MPIKIKPALIAEMESEEQAFSDCIQIGNHYHFSGVIAIDDNECPDGDTREQTLKVLQKMYDLLEACGLTTNDIYSATVMLAGDMSDYDLFEQRWLAIFASSKFKPRGKAFAVTALPFGCAIAIEFDAVDQSED